MHHTFKDPRDITLNVSGRKAGKGSWVSIGKKYIYISRKNRGRSYWKGPAASKLKFSDRNHSARIGSNLVKFKTNGGYQKAKKLFSNRSVGKKSSRGSKRKTSKSRSRSTRRKLRSGRSVRRRSRSRRFGKGVRVNHLCIVCEEPACQHIQVAMLGGSPTSAKNKNLSNIKYRDLYFCKEHQKKLRNSEYERIVYNNC